MLFCEVHPALFFSIESARILSQPPSPVRVLEGQPLKLEWTLSVQGTFRRLEFKLSEAVGAFVEIIPLSSPFITSEFEDRLNASLTGRNLTITFFSMNRTDSANYEFRVFGSSGSISVSLRVIVECKYTVNLSLVCNTEKSVLKYICIISYHILYNNKINARVLIGQSAMVYFAVKHMEKSRVF